MIVIPSGLSSAEELAGRSLALTRIAYDNALRDIAPTSITASGETADGPGDAPTSPDTHTFWEPDALDATWVARFTAQEFGHFSVAAHTLGSSGCTVTVETSDGTFIGSPDTDAAEVWTQWSDAFSPEDDAPIMFIDSPRSSISGVRVTISGGSTIPRIGVFSCGDLLTMQTKIRGAGWTPPTMARSTVLKHALSRGGQFLGQEIRRTGVTFTVSFEHLDSDWVRETFNPFAEAARQYPFFLAWRPLEYPDEVAYAWSISGDIRPQYMGILDLMQVNWEMAGFVE